MLDKEYRSEGEYPCGVADFPKLRRYVNEITLVYEMIRINLLRGITDKRANN